MIQRRRSPGSDHPHMPGEVCPTCDIDYGSQVVVKTRQAGHIHVTAYAFTDVRPPADVLKGVFVNEPEKVEARRNTARAHRAEAGQHR